METRKRHIKHIIVNGHDIYQEWFEGLNDIEGRASIRKRIDRVKEGNFGDHGTVHHGVQELRIKYGPGYRIYYGEDGPVVVILLCGGDKHSQSRDVRQAHELWLLYRRKK